MVPGAPTTEARASALPLRVALVTEGRLVGQAIAAALSYRRVVPLLFEWPAHDNRITALRRRIVAAEADLGVLLSGLEHPDRLQAIEHLVSFDALPWLVLTDTAPGPRWGVVLEAGAAAVLPTSTSMEVLLVAMRDVVAGRPAMPEELRQRLIEEWSSVAESYRSLVRRMERLTPRETTVLAMLYEGKSVREIADVTSVSESTVRSHVKRLRSKLEVGSQLGAVALYRRALEVVPRSDLHVP